MNVELMKKVRDAIADEDNAVGFDMGAWGWEEWDGERQCGTVACIAGHTAIQAGLDLAPANVSRAGELLGLSLDDENYLFYWTWASSWRHVPTRAETVAYLDRCIEAGELVRIKRRS